MISMSPPIRAARAIGCLMGALALLGCETRSFDEDFTPPEDDKFSNVIDATNLNDLMLTVSNPEDAVAYFRDASRSQPDRPDLKRGYALALARARRHAEAVRLFEEIEQAGEANDVLRVEYAHSLARLQRWQDAENQMALVSSAVATPRRHLMDGMLADHRGDWTGADASYEKARLLSPNPAKILNNWGVSRLSRGEHKLAEKTFEEAVAYDPRLFSIKNNLAVSRALQGQYRLPLVSVNEEERAKLLHNVGVIALRRGDTDEAKGLFTMAVAAHPRHYAAAAEKLAALEASVVN